MIKQLRKSDVLVSPFVATKAWEFFNIENPDLVLVDPDSIPLALDYIDYNNGNPLVNRECNIALEQQESDHAMFEEGISGSIGFNIDSYGKNYNGTYKTLVYNQIKNSFYNNYKNPFEIFGMENVDFPLSKTNRYLADDFRIFTVPQKVFGDKILEGSVQFYDTAFDDNVEIKDDKFGNLIARNNLFSKFQETRDLENIIIDGTATYDCPTATPMMEILAWQNGTFPQAIVFWGTFESEYPMELSRSDDNGISWGFSTLISTGSGSYYYIDDSVDVGASYTYKVKEHASFGFQSSPVSVTIQPYDSSRIAYGFTADMGYQLTGPEDVPWEFHTMSLSRANYAARKMLGITKWVFGGDNGYKSNTFHGGYDGQIGRLLGPSQSFVPCLGNHDISDMGPPDLALPRVWNYLNYFNPPGRYYTTKESNIQIFALETVSQDGPALNSGSSQWNWFSSSCAESLLDPSITWRIAIVHVPVIVSKGSYNGNPYLQAIPWKQWGMDVVFTGHVHWAERLESGSMLFQNSSLMGSDRRSPTIISPYTKWWYAGYTGPGDYNDYIWSLLEFQSGSNKFAFSMSFYSGSVKVPDTGSTTLTNGMMSGGSLVLMKPWYDAAQLTASQVGNLTQSYVNWTFNGNYSMSLYRSTDSGLTWPVTYSINPGTYEYYDNSVSFGNTYAYMVQQTRFPNEPLSNISSTPILP